MKKIFSLLLVLSMCLVLAACENSESIKTARTTGKTVSQEGNSAITEESNTLDEVQKTKESNSAQQTDDVDTDDRKILVAYFSRTGENYSVGNIEKGNTHIVADMIAEQIDGDMFEISTVTPYPDDYDACTEVAKQEQNDNARPELAASVENIEDYDIIFLGYPIWWSDMPMAVYTFLESYDFSSKTIVPFCTHEGSGLASSESSIAEACPDAKILDGFSIRGTTAQNSQDETKTSVINWLEEIGFSERE